jgi:hypothetical protein
MPILGIMASQISGKLWSPDGAYDSLSTVTVPSGGVASITFAGIPTGYKHLQLRFTTRSSASGGSDNISFQFNNDTAGNYSWHYIYASGSIVAAGSGASATNIFAMQTSGTTALANAFGVAVVDILDYSNTSKNKTVRSLNGYDLNGSGYVFYQSGLWMSTSAINSIKINPGTGFSQYSQVSLYGVR